MIGVATRAAAELELRRREALELSSLGLLDFVPAVTPRFESPVHLKPFADPLDTIDQGEELRLVCHSPPRHGKTELLLHLIARTLMRRPEIQIGYASYSADVAGSKSEKARNLAWGLGVDIVSPRASDWRTSAGGGLLARGVGGGWTAFGLDLLIIDDPIKDRADAESQAYRRRTWDWFNDAAYTRVEPMGSVIVNMARWHPQDLAGKLIADGWEYLRIPAICDSDDDPLGRGIGEALWPSRWPTERLADKMRNEFTAASLFQGRPRPRGSMLFRDAYFYTALPEERFQTGIGFDLAYTAKSSADYSVAGSFVKSGDLTYLTNVERHQIEAARFGAILEEFQGHHGGRARIYYGGGAEKAAIEYLERDFNVRVNAKYATVDKFVRAQPAATDWNAGQILLPSRAPWVAEFLEEVNSFTGVSDDHDDQVDMLAAGFDEVAVTTTFEHQFGEPRRYGSRARGWA